MPRRKKVLMTKTEFAKKCGVTSSYIANYIKTHPEILDGKFIDANHPTAKEYAAKDRSKPKIPRRKGKVPLAKRKGTKQTPGGRRSHRGYVSEDFENGKLKAAAQEKTKEAPPQGEEPTITGPQKEALAIHDGEVLDNLTLREIVDKFGTLYLFYDHLRSVKEIEMIKERKLKNDERAGELINRELVIKGIIDPFNSAHKKLLTDGAKTIVAAVIAKNKAGIAPGKIEEYVADVLGSFIRPVKDKTRKALEAMKKNG